MGGKSAQHIVPDYLILIHATAMYCSSLPFMGYADRMDNAIMSWKKKRLKHTAAETLFSLSFTEDIEFLHE
jgi:hypothetical protein